MSIFYAIITDMADDGVKRIISCFIKYFPTESQESNQFN